MSEGFGTRMIPGTAQPRRGKRAGGPRLMAVLSGTFSRLSDKDRRRLARAVERGNRFPIDRGDGMNEGQVKRWRRIARGRGLKPDLIRLMVEDARATWRMANGSVRRRMSADMDAGRVLL